jgi:hypothetical protein
MYFKENSNYINTQNNWVFGLCPSSEILKTREHNVLETGSVPVHGLKNNVKLNFRT